MLNLKTEKFCLAFQEEMFTIHTFLIINQSKKTESRKTLMHSFLFGKNPHILTIRKQTTNTLPL